MPPTGAAYRSGLRWQDRRPVLVGNRWFESRVGIRLIPDPGRESGRVASTLARARAFSPYRQTMMSSGALRVMSGTAASAAG
jgi:hypothetical protein